jgi:hypothetical protein
VTAARRSPIGHPGASRGAPGALASAARLAAHGLEIDLPLRWEARIYLRDAPPRHAIGPGLHPAAYGWAGESPNPVAHLANFALPPGRGDFGTGAVELMRPGHVFLALVEYDRSEAHRPLFAATGMPRPAAHEFSPAALQRRLPEQGGWQRFCTMAERAFCLYVVLGSLRRARDHVPEICRVLDGIGVASR